MVIGFFEYEVRFDPTVDNFGERRRLMKQLEAQIGVFNFDGAKALLPKALPAVFNDYEGKFSTTGETVKITMKKIKDVGFGDPQCIYLYNSMIGKIMKILKLVQMKRSHYDPSNNKQIPRHKLEVWPGYVTAVDEYEGGLMLMCDVSHRILRNETAHDVLKDINLRGRANPGLSVKNEAERELIGATIITRYNNKIYRHVTTSE